MKRNYRWHLQFSRTPIVFTVAQETVERRRFRGMAPFPGKTKKKLRVLHFRKEVTLAFAVFHHEENLGNFHIFPLPMNSISDRKDSPRKSARWQRPGWDTLAVETVRQ